MGVERETKNALQAQKRNRKTALGVYKAGKQSLNSPICYKSCLMYFSILKHINGSCGGWKGKYHHIKGPHCQVCFPESKNMKRYATEKN